MYERANRVVLAPDEGGRGFEYGCSGGRVVGLVVVVVFVTQVFSVLYSSDEVRVGGVGGGDGECVNEDNNEEQDDCDVASFLLLYLFFFRVKVFLFLLLLLFFFLTLLAPSA